MCQRSGYISVTVQRKNDNSHVKSDELLFCEEGT